MKVKFLKDYQYRSQTFKAGEIVDIKDIHMENWQIDVLAKAGNIMEYV